MGKEYKYHIGTTPLLFAPELVCGQHAQPGNDVAESLVFEESWKVLGQELPRGVVGVGQAFQWGSGGQKPIRSNIVLP